MELQTLLKYKLGNSLTVWGNSNDRASNVGTLLWSNKAWSIERQDEAWSVHCAVEVRKLPDTLIFFILLLFAVEGLPGMSLCALVGAIVGAIVAAIVCCSI